MIYRHLHVGLFALVLGLAAASFAAPPAEYGEVELLRDAWGTAHVFSETDPGAFYGLGYACAEDRGFQMHYTLRMIQGRLAEVIGDVEKQGGGAAQTAAQHDALMRTFGFARAAEDVVGALDSETRAMLQAYCDGVNDYFAEHPQPNPLFQETGLEPEPWTPADCILSWWHLAKFFAKDGLNDLPTLEAARPRGPQVAPDDEAAVVRREDVSQEWIDRVDAFVREHGLDPRGQQGSEPDPKFSHAWVIGGDLTTTGAAVLVSDPQTPGWNPSMLYEFHASGETFNVRGIGVAGSPVILIGFNEKVAWGMTALGADQADLFLLETSPDRPNQYKVDGQWRDMEVREETIRIKGGGERSVTVRETIFGPVVSEWVRRNGGEDEFALARVPIVEKDRETAQAMLPMFRAGSCQDFAGALPQWRFPTANCIFGDAAGAIGYWTLGALPVRSTLGDVTGTAAQDGSTMACAWQGMIPYDLLPHVINPKRGYLVSANHRSIQSFYRMPFGNMTGAGGDTDRGLRIKERIQAHLAEHEKFTPAQVLAIQYDMVNVWKREIARLGYALLERDPDRLPEPARDALDYLREWYGAGAAMDTRTPGTELAEQMGVIFRGGQHAIVSKYGGGVSGLASFAKATRARFEDDPDAPVSEVEASFVDAVLSAAWQKAERAYGDDPAVWHQRALASLESQRMPYMASLDGFGGLDESLDVRLPRLQTQDGATILSQKAQAYTQYVPLHDVDAARSILPPGPSENPGSPFRFTSYADWAQGRLHPAPLSREAVEAIAFSVEDLRAPAETAQAETPPERRPEAPREALPGARPTGPVLEGAIRYLNRKERSPEEVAAKLEELRSYVQRDAARKEELLKGLELFLHLMRSSQQNDDARIVYGTPETLRQVERFNLELQNTD